MKKQIISALVAGAFLFALPAQAASTEVYRNNERLDTKSPILNVSDRTMMGFRDYFQAVNSPVSWDNDLRTAITEFEGKMIYIMPDSQEVIVDGKYIDLDVPPQIINDHIYLPLRFFGETMGYTVDFKVLADGGYWVNLSNTPALPPVEENKFPVTLPANTQVIPYLTGPNASRGHYVIDGKLVELVGFDRYVEKRVIDPNTGAASTQNFSVMGSPNIINDVFIDGNDLLFSVNKDSHTAPAPYVGPGKPSYVKPFATMATSLGDIAVYGTDTGSSAYQVDGHQLIQRNQRQEALVLELPKAFSASDFVLGDQGRMAAIIDHTLLIYDRNGLIAERPVDTTDLLFIGGNFVSYGNLGNDLALEIYDQAGHLLGSSLEIGLAGQGKTLLADYLLEGDNLSLLIHNDRQSAIAKVSLSNPRNPSPSLLGENILYTDFAPDTNGNFYVVGQGDATYLTRLA